MPAMLLFLVMAAPVPVQAQPGCAEPASEPVTICGITVVTGAGGGAIRIHVPEDAVLNGETRGFVDRFSGILFEGAGPMLGFVLSDNLAAGDGGLYLQAIRLARDYHHILQDFVATNLDEVDRGKYLVPAGDYSLYLVSNGSPVTATIPFDNLEGEVRVTTGRRTELDFYDLRNHLDPQGTGQRHAYSVGAGETFEHGGLVMMTNDVLLPVGDVESSGYCYYFGEPQDDRTAYLPGCPARFTEGQDAFELIFLPGPVLGGWQSYTWATSPTGGRGLGFWRAGANPGVRLASVAFFLGFEQKG